MLVFVPVSFSFWSSIGAAVPLASAIDAVPNRCIHNPPSGIDLNDPNASLYASKDDKTLAGMYNLLFKKYADHPDILSHHTENLTDRTFYVGDRAFYVVLRWQSRNPKVDAAGVNQCFYRTGQYRGGAPPGDQLNRDIAIGNLTTYNKEEEALNFHRNNNGSSAVNRPAGGTVDVNDTACEYAFSGLQSVARMLASDFDLDQVELIDVGTHMYNQLVDKNAYLPSYIRYDPVQNNFRYTNHTNSRQLNPFRLMLNTPTKSSTNLLGHGGGAVCSAGWMVCFGTPTGICPVREQCDCVDLQVAVPATAFPYNLGAFVPPAGQSTWALVLEGLTPMAFSWHSESAAMIGNNYVYL